MRKLVLLSALLSIFTSCSVVMAAKKEGVSVSQVQSCHTRAQVIATGSHLIESRRFETGELVEVYQVQKERGSVARAFMHGLLDVSTCGLWEIVGTPIEAYSNTKEYFFIRVTYDQDEMIKKVELF